MTSLLRTPLDDVDANMVKKQRGKRVSASGGKRTDGLNLLLSDSDDEAPEEVTFEESKAQALRSLKEAMDAVRREKEHQKEKRRRRQEQLEQQKKKRTLLPDAVLEELERAGPGEARRSEEPEEEDEEEEEQTKARKRKRGGGRNTKTIAGGYTVTTLRQRGAERSQQDAAEEFLRSRLYGPGSRRTTCNEMLSLQNKKGRKKSAAVQFVKKDWACQQKARAEKLKKRWIHQQNPS